MIDQSDNLRNIFCWFGNLSDLGFLFAGIWAKRSVDQRDGTAGFIVSFIDYGTGNE